MTQLQQDLQKAINLIEQHGYRRGSCAFMEGIGYSLHGAINTAVFSAGSIFSKDGRCSRAEIALKLSIKKRKEPFESIDQWQRAYGRTKEQVIDLLRYTIVEFQA